MRDRVHSGEIAEQVDIALDLIPESIRVRLTGVGFVLGVDPVFAGVHHFIDTDDGRSYREVAHCCYPHHVLGHAKDRRTTICVPAVTPGWGGVRELVHELGHALDSTLGFQHEADPVNDYAALNRAEAFAEAFAYWVWGDDGVDPATEHLFRDLEVM